MTDEFKSVREIPLGWEVMADFRDSEEGSAIAVRNDFRNHGKAAEVTRCEKGNLQVWVAFFSCWPWR